MENEEDLMSIFGSNPELNFESFNYDEDTDEDLDEKDPNLDPDKPLVEEEDPESVDKEDDDESEENDSGESSPTLYSSFANVLLEQGIIPSLESSEKIKTIDDLGEAIKTEIGIQAAQIAEQRLSNLDLEKIANSRKAVIELDSITEEYLKDNLDVAKDIILRDYLNQGLSEDRAKKMLRKTIDLGEDVVIEDALESKLSLQEFEKKQEVLEKERYEKDLKLQREEQEKIDNAIKDYIFNSKEVVKGLPNTKALQEKVFKTMTEVVAKNPDTGELENKLMKDRSADPIKFDTRMYYFYELTNGFTDLGKIATVTTSKATKTLEKVLRKTNFEDNGTPGYLQDPQSYGGIGSELVI